MIALANLGPDVSWCEVSGLKNRCALVFGVADGIGLEVALGLAASGAHVACVDVNLSVAQEAAGRVVEAGGRAVSIEADVTDRTNVREAVAQAVAAFGPIECCVDVVGAAPLTPVLDGDDQVWDLAMNLNLRQAYIVAGEVLPGMRESGGGSLCFISSIAAISSMPNKAAYGAAKAGVVSLTKTLAVENAPFGIRVNAVAPGVILTPAIRLRDAGNAGGGRASILASVPLGRYGETREIAGAVLLLTSRLASYVTGQLLTVDGGASSRYALPETLAGWQDANAMKAYYDLPANQRLEALARRSASQGEGPDEPGEPPALAYPQV